MNVFFFYYYYYCNSDRDRGPPDMIIDCELGKVPAAPSKLANLPVHSSSPPIQYGCTWRSESRVCRQTGPEERSVHVCLASDVLVLAVRVRNMPGMCAPACLHPAKDFQNLIRLLHFCSNCCDLVSSPSLHLLLSNIIPRYLNSTHNVLSL